MFAAILSKCKSYHYKCPHPEDETKLIHVKYQKKREMIFAAVDSSKWSSSSEISCDDIGDIIRDSPLHFPYETPERSLEWIAENLIRIKYDHLLILRIALKLFYLIFKCVLVCEDDLLKN